MKTLGEVLQALPNDWNLDLKFLDLSNRVSGITVDSREVPPGSIFVAITGEKKDGHAFISTVEQSGPRLIIGEKKLSQKIAVPYLCVPDSRLALGLMAGAIYGNPSFKIKMLGVTGTSGKTTTTYLLESILKAAGFHVGVIGTVNFRYGKKIYPSTHTTPGPLELQKLLVEMKLDGVNAVVMEVSSHALKQHRVAGIAWDGMVFTNLTREHLDFHPHMDDYYQSKAKLFGECVDYSIAHGKKPFSAINIDDSYGEKLFEETSRMNRPPSTLASFGLASQGLICDLNGIHGKVNQIEIRSSLTATFNLQNILGAVCLAHGIGISNQDVSAGIARLKSIPGRLEAVPNKRDIHIWVDYAHKPGALEKVLETLHALRGKGALITVFGCGGDRDREKRPVMGKLSVTFSDYVFVTSDNPRTEDPAAIIQEIVKGMGSVVHYQVEPDRRKAIFQAIKKARPGDLVLIAGKGHEDYQIFGNTKIHFDDREVVAEALQDIN